MLKSPHFRNLLISVPFLVLTIAPFLFLDAYFNTSINLLYVALGAFGWWLALLLRVPVLASVRKLAQEKSRTIVTLSSGPIEEGVRLGIMLVIGLSTGNALSVGIGWAAIEIIYSIVQGVAMSLLQTRTDAKAVEAKAVLETMGMSKALSSSAPFWGIVERLSANALHIGFTLALVISPFAAFITAPVHSLINYALTLLLKRSLFAAETVVFLMASVVFAVVLIFI